MHGRRTLVRRTVAQKVENLHRLGPAVNMFWLLHCAQGPTFLKHVCVIVTPLGSAHKSSRAPRARGHRWPWRARRACSSCRTWAARTGRLRTRCCRASTTSRPTKRSGSGSARGLHACTHLILDACMAGAAAAERAAGGHRRGGARRRACAAGPRRARRAGDARRGGCAAPRRARHACMHRLESRCMRRRRAAARRGRHGALAATRRAAARRHGGR